MVALVELMLTLLISPVLFSPAKTPTFSNTLFFTETASNATLPFGIFIAKFFIVPLLMPTKAPIWLTALSVCLVSSSLLKFKLTDFLAVFSSLILTPFSTIPITPPTATPLVSSVLFVVSAYFVERFPVLEIKPNSMLKSPLSKIPIIPPMRSGVG